MSQPPVIPVRRPSRAGWWLAVPLCVFLFVCGRAIEFGHHWDESLLQTNVETSLRTRLLLPTGACNYDGPGLTGGNYEYPSLLYWVGIGCASPEVVHGGLDYKTPMPTAFATEHAFAVRVRWACLAIASLSILFAGRLARAITGRWGPGLIAAWLLASSWQVQYHSRWVAPDMLATTFTAACLAACGFAIERRAADVARVSSPCSDESNAPPTTEQTAHQNTGYKPVPLDTAAVFAGLAMGAKYPMGLLVVPVVMTAWMTRRGFGSRSWAVLETIFVMAAVFVATTPGAALQPWNFAAWLVQDVKHYGVDGHYGHTIRNPIAMASATGQYLLFSLFSRDKWVSVSIAALAGIGLVATYFRSWRLGLILTIFPALYVGYFCLQVVLLVRNLLVLAPLIGALAATGVWAVSRVNRLIPYTAAASVVAWNLVWCFHASSDVPTRQSPDWQVAQATAYLSGHPQLRVFPTELVAAKTGLPLVPPPRSNTTDCVLCFAQEDGDVWDWPANIHGLTRASFGPDVVDFDYYPNWQDNRLVLVDVDAARRVPVTQVERAVKRAELSTENPAHPPLIYYACGRDPSLTNDGVTIRQTHGDRCGKPYDVGVPLPDARGIASDRDHVTFEITGLDPHKRYHVGWSWWDWNGGHRVESVRAMPGVGPEELGKGFVLLGPTPLPRWPLVDEWGPHRSSPLWPPAGVTRGSDRSVAIPPEMYKDGSTRVVFRNEGAYDVVVTGLWITE